MIKFSDAESPPVWTVPRVLLGTTGAGRFCWWGKNDNLFFSANCTCNTWFLTSVDESLWQQGDFPWRPLCISDCSTQTRDRNKGPDEECSWFFLLYKKRWQSSRVIQPHDVQVTVRQVWDTVEPPLFQQHQQTAVHAGHTSQDHAAVALPSLLPIPLTLWVGLWQGLSGHQMHHCCFAKRKF